jgi:hypothetical protein
MTKMKITEYLNYSMESGNLIYLATPYSSKHTEIQAKRALAVTALSARLMEHGIYNFSPITQSYAQHQTAPLPGTWDFWEQHDAFILRKCDELWIYTQKGWTESAGVKGEIEYAKSYGLPIRYIQTLPAAGDQLDTIHVFDTVRDIVACHPKSV